MLNYYENPWIYNNIPFLEKDISNYYGFVYKITNLINNRLYIGRKYFYVNRKGNELNKQLKYNNEWLKYYGSSDELKNDIKIYGKNNFKREILFLYENKDEVDSAEINEQFKRNVLHEKKEDGTKLYYNISIMSKYFSMNEFAAKKISISLKDKPKSEEHKKSLSNSHKGKSPWNKNILMKDTDTIYGWPKGKSKDDELKNRISKTVLNLYKTGQLVSHFKNRKVTEEERIKISEFLKIKGNFVVNNPNKNENIYYTIINEFNDLFIINNFKDWCKNKNIIVVNLIAWSKENVNNKRLHPKYKIKILKIENKKTSTIYFDSTTFKKEI